MQPWEGVIWQINDLRNRTRSITFRLPGRIVMQSTPKRSVSNRFCIILLYFVCMYLVSSNHEFFFLNLSHRMINQNFDP